MDELGIDKMVILGKDYGKPGDRLQSNLPDVYVQFGGNDSAY